MKARIAERGQVTIPKALRKRLGLGPGTILQFAEEDGRLVAIKDGSIDPVSKLYGCLGKKLDTDATIAKLRGARP
jgi:antitoxin PrlF